MRGRVNGRFGKHIGRLGDLLASPPVRVVLFSVILLIPVFFLPALAGASEGAEEGHGGRNWADFGWRFLNFIVLAGFFYWLLAKKTKDFFAGRRESLRTTLADAVTAKEEAARKLRESTERLERASGEIKEATESIRVQGLREKERIIAEARKTAEKMKDDARKRLEQELRRASNMLKAETVDLSLKMSEEILRQNIGAQDHQALVRNSINKVVDKQ